MATVVRIKRKSTDPPLCAVVLSVKRQRETSSSHVTVENLEQVFHLSRTDLALKVQELQEENDNCFCSNPLNNQDSFMGAVEEIRQHFSKKRSLPIMESQNGTGSNLFTESGSEDLQTRILDFISHNRKIVTARRKRESISCTDVIDADIVDNHGKCYFADSPLKPNGPNLTDVHSGDNASTSAMSIIPKDVSTEFVYDYYVAPSKGKTSISWIDEDVDIRAFDYDYDSVDLINQADGDCGSGEDSESTDSENNWRHCDYPDEDGDEHCTSSNGDYWRDDFEKYADEDEFSDNTFQRYSSNKQQREPVYVDSSSCFGGRSYRNNNNFDGYACDSSAASDSGSEADESLVAEMNSETLLINIRQLELGNTNDDL